MKKLSILALAAILVVFFTVPAAALENEFGGYWRTRYFSQKYFSGYDRGDRTLPSSVDPANIAAAEDDTIERADTRTRLYYTAKINDNLKLVNKFEFDAVFGGDGSSNSPSSDYGKVGADGVSVEVKNSYADFNLGPVNITAGVQPYSLFRDFAISDDASGIIARWKAMDKFILAGSWLKNFEGGEGTGENEDLDTYTLTGAIFFNENISLKPSISVAYTDELNGGLALSIFNRQSGPGENIPLWDFGQNFGETYLASFGADFDMTFDKWGLWVTAYGQVGEIEDVVALVELDALGQQKVEDVDLDGWLVALGGNVGFGELGFLGDFGLHSEFFAASGDDSEIDDDFDDDQERILNPFGSYYWSEIMGLGILDNRAPSGSPADRINNIMAFNLGVDMKPLDKLKITVDYWYAELLEEEQRLNEEDELGHELNLLVTYELVEGLNMDIIGAYLWADDAVAAGFEENEEDPYEYGVRLSLSF